MLNINRVAEFVSNYFWIFFIFGLLAGIFLPFSFLLSPYIVYLLMFVLLLSCLKIELRQVFERIKDFRLVVFLIIWILVFIPLLIYFPFRIFLDYEYSLAILTLLVMPTGMCVPVYATIFKGDKELALALSVATSLICPLTIPTLMYFLVGIKANINPVQMFLSLSMIILSPFIISLFLKKIAKEIIRKTERYYPSISVLFISCIIAGATAKIGFIDVIANNREIIYPFLLLFAVAGLLTIIGYLVLYERSVKTKITSSLATAYMNSTLAIVFCAQFFGPKTLLLVTMYQLPTNLTLIAFGYIAKNYLLREKEMTLP